MDYMAPEQVQDAASVDIRADIYGLGATLFWCLAGRTPFQSKDNLDLDAAARITQPPPSLRALLPQIPADLDAVVAGMMALRPQDRFPTPRAVMDALVPFLKNRLPEQLLPRNDGELDAVLPSQAAKGKARSHQILIVDDESSIRNFCKFTLHSEELQCDEAASGIMGLAATAGKRYDLVLLDIDMPGMCGPDVCRHLRESPPCPHLKIIMMSGRASADEMAAIMLAGADDFLTKPFSMLQLQARINAALRLKDAQDRSDLLNNQLLAINQELEQTLGARDSDLVHARNALVLALAEIVGYRDAETGAHLVRLQQYCRILAEEAARLPHWSSILDSNFIDMLECCVPLHDIGKASLPDHILLKPGKLTAEERLVMQTHTTMGAETLQKVAQRHGFARAFLQMAMEITRHHHERYNGKGYPDRLSGDDIPLAARIVAIADVYDALRSWRVYKPALSHTTSLRMMVQESPGHFDPSLLQAFERCAPSFERVFSELAD
jgi:response regulator RpfG family c-di-GMP phosphodiesterase